MIFVEALQTLAESPWSWVMLILIGLGIALGVVTR